MEGMTRIIANIGRIIIENQQTSNEKGIYPNRDYYARDRDFREPDSYNKEA